MNDTSQHPDDFANRYEAAAARFFDRIDGACARKADWPQRVGAAIEAALAFLAAEPALARLLLFEPYEAGHQAQLRHEATLARLAELLRTGREQVPAPPMPAMVEEGLVGGLSFIVGRPLRAGQPELLPALAPELTTLVLTPYLGREEAKRIAAGTA